jgi:hypothetical protein
MTGPHHSEAEGEAPRPTQGTCLTPTPGPCPRADLREGRQTNQGTPASPTPKTARFQPRLDGGIPCLRDPARGALELRGDRCVRLPCLALAGSGLRRKATQLRELSPRKGKHLAGKRNDSAQRRSPTRISRSAGLRTHSLSDTTGSRDAPSSKAATTPNNTAQPSPDSTKEDHETDNGSVGVDDEAIAFWGHTCAAMPPLSPATIAAIAVIVRRIDRRRAQQ